MKFYEITLTFKTTSITLTHNPGNWANFSIKLGRSRDYYAVNRSFSLGCRFFREGKSFIDNAFAVDGINAEVSIVIKEQNLISLTYDTVFFEGIIDMESKISTRDYTEVSLIDSSITAKLKAREEIEYNLFDNISNDGVTLPEFDDEYKLISLTPIDLYRLGEVNLLEKNLQLILEQIPESDESYLFFNEIVKNDLADKIAFNYPTAGAGDIFYDNTDELEYTVKIKFNYLINFSTSRFLANPANGGSCSFNLYIRVYNDTVESGSVSSGNLIKGVRYSILDNSGGADFVLFGAPDNNVGTIFICTVTGEPTWGTGELFVYTTIEDILVLGYSTIDVETKVFEDVFEYERIFQQNYKYKLFLSADGLGPTISGKYFMNLKINGDVLIQEISESFPATNVKALFTYEAFTRLLQKITDRTDQVIYSEVFGRTDSEFETYSANGDLALQAITRGMLIRGKNVSLNCSLKSLFQSLSARVPVGLWYDNTNDRFKIEKVETFFDKNTVYDLGEVSNLVTKNAVQLYYNEISSGYQDSLSYNEYSGVQEIQTKTSFSTINKIKNTFNCSSPYRSDSVGIELCRRAGITTKDNDADDDIFIIDAELIDGVYEPHKTFAESSDIPNIDEYYNNKYTPKRCLKNNSKLFAGAMWKDTSSSIRFVKNQMDNEALTRDTLEGVYTSEKDDVLVSSIYNPLFIPLIYEFECVADSELTAQLKSNPHVMFRFTYLGSTYNGFIDFDDAVDINLYSQKAVFRLLKANI